MYLYDICNVVRLFVSIVNDINNNYVACVFLILTLFNDIVRYYAQDRPWDENQETT